MLAASGTLQAGSEVRNTQSLGTGYTGWEDCNPLVGVYFAVSGGRVVGCPAVPTVCMHSPRHAVVLTLC